MPVSLPLENIALENQSVGILGVVNPETPIARNE